MEARRTEREKEDDNSQTRWILPVWMKGSAWWGDYLRRRTEILQVDAISTRSTWAEPTCSWALRQAQRSRTPGRMPGSLCLMRNISHIIWNVPRTSWNNFLKHLKSQSQGLGFYLKWGRRILLRAVFLLWAGPCFLLDLGAVSELESHGQQSSGRWFAGFFL